jgi:hypothetical protein
MEFLNLYIMHDRIKEHKTKKYREDDQLINNVINIEKFTKFFMKPEIQEAISKISSF